MPIASRTRHMLRTVPLPDATVTALLAGWPDTRTHLAANPNLTGASRRRLWGQLEATKDRTELGRFSYDLWDDLAPDPATPVAVLADIVWRGTEQQMRAAVDNRRSVPKAVWQTLAARTGQPADILDRLLDHPRAEVALTAAAHAHPADHPWDAPALWDCDPAGWGEDRPSSLPTGQVRTLLTAFHDQVRVNGDTAAPHMTRKRLLSKWPTLVGDVAAADLHVFAPEVAASPWVAAYPDAGRWAVNILRDRAHHALRPAMGNPTMPEDVFTPKERADRHGVDVEHDPDPARWQPDLFTSTLAYLRTGDEWALMRAAMAPSGGKAAARRVADMYTAGDERSWRLVPRPHAHVPVEIVRAVLSRDRRDVELVDPVTVPVPPVATGCPRTSFKPAEVEAAARLGDNVAAWKAFDRLWTAGASLTAVINATFTIVTPTSRP